MVFAENRKKTRQISVGNIKIGGFAPIAFQSMTNTFTQNVEETVSQIKILEEAGCEIIRVAVPDEDAASAISSVVAESATALASASAAICCCYGG